MKIKDNIASEFDAFSENYTSDMIGCVPHYLKLMSSFTEQLPQNFKPSHILDLGCGNGNVTAKLLHSFPDAQYTLLDASEQMLDLCKQQFHKYKVKYVASYFQDFEFNSVRYDLIVAGFSLHHCDSDEKKEIFKKIYKSLKIGGVLSITDLMISKDNPTHNILLKEWETFVNTNFPDGEKWKWLMEHYDEFDKPDNYVDQIEWLKNAGFKTVEISNKHLNWMHLQTIKD